MRRHINKTRVLRANRVSSLLPDKADIRWFRQRLFSWFKYNRRDFPWRHSSDPYVICMSEIFLQQTSARKVADIIGAFTARFPDWSTLAEATPAEIERVIYPLGIYRRRAKTIHSLANAVVSLDSLPRTRRGSFTTAFHSPPRYCPGV